MHSQKNDYNKRTSIPFVYQSHIIKISWTNKRLGCGW
jgi:hypothetical protein